MMLNETAGTILSLCSVITTPASSKNGGAHGKQITRARSCRRRRCRPPPRHCNTIGFFTENILLDRHGTAEDIDKSELYRASDQASFTTGAMLIPDDTMGV